MALVRMTEKKLAANRANAKKSKGPTTPAGKEKVSRNACRHHLCARKHLLPPSWDARYLSFSQPLVDSRPDRDDPAVRTAASRLVHFTLWFAEEEAIQARRVNFHIALHAGNSRLGTACCIQQDPIFHRQAITLRRIGQEIDRTLRALKACRTTTKNRSSIPYLAENTSLPKAMAASAGAGGSTGDHTEFRQSPTPRNPLAPPPITRESPAPWLSPSHSSPANWVVKLIYPLNNSPPP